MTSSMTDAARSRAIYERLSAIRDQWYPTALSRYYGQPFKALVAGILSARTREEQTTAATDRLFERVETPADLLALPEATLRDILTDITYGESKVGYLLRTAELLIAQGGQVPDTLDGLQALPGVGWKVATLTLLVGFRNPDVICVDVHVARIGKRLGFVALSVKQPQAVEEVLKQVLPHDLWPNWNMLMVQFGREVCRPTYPQCRTCPIRDLCPRIGVHPR